MPLRECPPSSAKIQSGTLLPLFAAAVYTEPGAQAALLKLLDDDDPYVAVEAMDLLTRMRPFQFANQDVPEFARVGPDIFPERFTQVLEKFPHLYIEVASNLGEYGPYAMGQVDALIPSPVFRRSLCGLCHERHDQRDQCRSRDEAGRQ